MLFDNYIIITYSAWDFDSCLIDLLATQPENNHFWGRCMAYITLYKVGEGKIIFGVNSAMEKKKKKKKIGDKHCNAR